MTVTPSPQSVGPLGPKRVLVLKSAVERLILAADMYGVAHLDSDDMDDDAVELQDATEGMKDALAAAPAPSSLAGGEVLDALDQELIDRGLRTVRAYDAVRFLREALSATTARLTGYDWNSDPDGLTKQQGDAFALADKVFADLSAAVDAHPDTELPECQSCGGTGKIEEAARTDGANQHSACIRTCDDCDGCGFAPDDEEPAILAALSPEAPALEGGDVAMGADDVEHRLPEVEGFGASYDRGQGKWILYSMPGAKPFGAVDGYDRASLDFVVNALRSALTPRHEAPAEDEARRKLIQCIEQWDGETEYDADDLASLADSILHAFNGPPVVSPAAPVQLSSNPCQLEAPDEGAGTEDTAWEWVAGLYPNDAPSDLAYDASEMVGAFVAGASLRARSSAPEARSGEGQ